MLKIENTDILGWETAIRGMRNPMNSWKSSDSKFNEEFEIGNNDYVLMNKLCKAGSDHRKFMRMIVVYLDITAPLYWWKEFDTYKVGTVSNSCSTMHKIQAKEFAIDDFSCEHLVQNDCVELMNTVVKILNSNRLCYLETKDKKYWWQMIQLLPSSYNQKRTIMMSYEVLHGVYLSRKNHKLDEWISLCKWIEELPHSELITNFKF